MSMKRIDRLKIKDWSAGVGGTTKAARLITNRTQCCWSLAIKVARGTYKSEPAYLFRKAICELTGFSENELFPEGN